MTKEVGMPAEFTEGGELVPRRSSPIGPPTIEHQIVTAQDVAIKRQIPGVLQQLRELAAMAGDAWFYRYSVRSGGGSDWIEGPSIKCANAVARIYGNCQIDTRVVDAGDNWTIYARFVDLETGFSYTRPYQQRKDQSTIGTRDRGRAHDIALQVGVSKAIRNVVTNALETFTTFAFEEARKNMVERVGKNLDEYRGRVIDRLGELRVDKARVERVLGRGSHEWLAPDVARIIAQLQAINDGMATADEAWPPMEGSVVSGSKLDQLEKVIRGQRGESDVPSPLPNETTTIPTNEKTFWERESFLVPIPSGQGKRHDFAAYRDTLVCLVGEAPDHGSLEKLQKDNARGISTLQLSAEPLHAEVMAAVAAKGE